MSDSRKYKPPQRSKADEAHALAKAGISGVPVVGGPLTELFQRIVQPPLDKRRDAWMHEVAAGLLALENKGLDLSGLQQNEEFISAVMHASQAALRTHQTEKLQALRNAIINIASGAGPEETTQYLLLGYVDELTEMHLRLLKAAQAPTPPPTMSMGGLGTVLAHCVPQLQGKTDLLGQLWRGLHDRGLVVSERLNMTISGSSLSERQTTGLGNQLLELIEAQPLA
ncbi:MAG: hypothetical protein M9919_07335 [Burkholderiaceae bacterium]|nr:hypothetical protein [Burkholderiaceae bacterium]